ncbi:DNA polymerase IV [Gordonia sp. HNM0687]|uniref:DNA-directed DNA polymerase n=1 Tax=Gordonia mangrovi TaxID=2665643 RepID=A0A6L7GLR2_9ACTN|nr:DNA polymerase IV [Gordonia mangrovi]MXP20367.1 DNA polymerase IV [Gordonia mangrovi]UVF79033.1 DNA polymerase IV [Gordonia mangrovi]
MADAARRHRWLIHVDLDQFQVSVERLRSPELVDVPVIVGGNGDPTEARKVVTCASYEARAVGVRAGMSLRAAHRKMPDAVYLPLDVPAYDVASADVMAVLRASGHPVEVWGWDEAYLGVDPVDDAAAHDRATIGELARRIRTDVFTRTGLHCSIGISDNKQRAKMATGFAKKPEPAAVDLAPFHIEKVYLLDEQNWLPLMGERACRELWSVGPKTAAKLSSHRVDTVEQLIATPREELIEIFGPHQGNWLYVLCRGGGDATITEEPWLARSHSKSRTYPTDFTDPDEMRLAALELTRDLLTEILSEQRVVFRVAVTVRTTTFYTRTKSRKLPAPTTRYDDIAPVVGELLGDFELDRPVRLLGVRCDLVMPEED